MSAAFTGCDDETETSSGVCRDMAFSENQNQLRWHGVASGIAPGGPEPVRSIALWAQVNLAASRFGADVLGERYHRIRFEDLCADAAGVAEELLAWAGLEGDASAAVAAVTAPAGIGRWRAADPALVADLERVAGARASLRVRLPALGSRAWRTASSCSGCTAAGRRP